MQFPTCAFVVAGLPVGEAAPGEVDGEIDGEIDGDMDGDFVAGAADGLVVGRDVGLGVGLGVGSGVGEAVGLADVASDGLAEEFAEEVADGSADGLAVEVVAMGCSWSGQADGPMSCSPVMSVSVLDTSTFSEAGSPSCTTALKKVKRICCGVARARTSSTPF